MTAELPVFTLSQSSIASLRRLSGITRDDVLLTEGDDRVVHRFSDDAATFAVRHRAEVTRQGCVSFTPSMIRSSWTELGWMPVTPFDEERFAVERLDYRTQYQILAEPPAIPTITRSDVTIDRRSFVRWIDRLTIESRALRAASQLWVDPSSEGRWRGTSARVSEISGTIDEVSVSGARIDELFALPSRAMQRFATFAKSERDNVVEVQLERDRALFRCGDTSLDVERTAGPSRAEFDALFARFRTDDQTVMLVDPTELREAIKSLTHKTMLELVTFAASKPGFAMLSTARKSTRIRIGGEPPVAPVSVSRAVLIDALDALDDASELELAFTVDRDPVVFRTPEGCMIRCPSRV